MQPLDAAAAIYAPSNNASTPHGKRMSVRPFFMYFKFFFCLERCIATYVFWLVHPLSPKLISVVVWLAVYVRNWRHFVELVTRNVTTQHGYNNIFMRVTNCYTKSV